jgi:hypothetical protein
MDQLTENFTPIIINNCFTEAHLLSAYRTMALAPHVVNTVTGKRDLVVSDPEFGYISYNKNPDSFVLNRVMELIRENTNIPVNNPDFHFAKYAKSSGYRPQLYPHYDTHLANPHLTLSIQVGGTFRWPMLIDGKSYVLQDNQGILFSGTHQIHWRQNVEFGDNDYNDVLLCQFKLLNDEILSEDHINHMESKKDKFFSSWERS